jgi:hypothetical protein
MDPRPRTLVNAIALNALFGVGGLGVGVQLLLASNNTGLGVRPVLVGIAIYGAVALIAAILLWRGSGIGWWLALASDGAGLVVLGWTLAISGLGDVVLLIGVAIWVVAIAMLIAPTTRAALRS